MNFDETKDRVGTFSAKFDAMQTFAGVPAEDGIAMWVADMDFSAADCVLDILREQADHGYLGYPGPAASVSDAIAGWMKAAHDWDVDPDWISYSHGVVAGFGMALEAFSDPGDDIILFTPVYHAFFKKAAAKRRGVVQSEMVLKDGRYFMDFDTLETQLTGREKIAVLCSPHNPGGRLWSAEEIRELAAFCQKHDLLLLSDEIHMDLAFPDAKHVPTAIAAPDAIDRLVVITAASKGFNLAGGETGFMIVPDPALREKLAPVQLEYGGTPNRFGMLMTRAAFTGGQDWSEAVRAYLADNFALWRDRISAIPGISVMDMPSTYLTWVDFAGTGMSPEETERRIRQDARIAQSPGADFGKGGENFHRFNIAMPRPRLIEAIERMEKAFGDLQ
ncbi:MalY/PatB family protein [Psychromarinibacter halotolerans]|uniref:cysteine-S-conjugate beta-lyase n=1 Tax=Psychromarinibacter halotolerans TaxID=1775175 RepID=A0ABV7H0Z8_9RHOB|nr:MalY/PatB family protein [Psychromarinibacter halotolerans]MDF0598607.1 pyridoxal phosphate-dependent aminotransferase [Psychromarinibacter halotolerans]